MRREAEPLIFEKSRPGRRGVTLPECDVPILDAAEVLGAGSLRSGLQLPEVSELDVVRHFTRLSQRNYAIDIGMYPLGSCTMKYNPKVNDRIASLPGLASLHPLQPEETVQGALQIQFELQEMLSEICGMSRTTLQPAAGAHGELLAMMMVRAFHRSRSEAHRNVVIIPDSAHGTNPASAARCGFVVKSIASASNGCVNLTALEAAMDTDVAAVMLTNPNTVGLFESDICKICDMVHDAGGLVYCDGANMNALLGIARPGDMGFDMMHFNLHKTFSTPHGGGGPGCGAVSVKMHLVPFLPSPIIEQTQQNGSLQYRLNPGSPSSVGRIHSFYGAFLIAVRAYAYIRSLGPDGLRRVGENAILNANYLRSQLSREFTIAFGSRLCMHEVVLSVQEQRIRYGVRAADISKRLMDFGVHPPTNYFPLIVPEALMIEPTETESKESLDEFIASMMTIAEECRTNPDVVKTAPHTTTISRLDETAAVKRLDVRWEGLFEEQ